MSTSAASSAPSALPSEKAKAAEATGKIEIPTDPTGIIDMETFNQIREMDEDEDDEGAAGGHEFSKGIVMGYFEQAESTFDQMEDAFAARDLGKLGGLGHFLKGSSAALGIVKVQASCEKMQHYGHKRDEERGSDLSEDDALARISPLIAACKADYEVAHAWLTRLYDGEDGDAAAAHGDGDDDDAAAAADIEDKKKAAEAAEKKAAAAEKK